MPSSPSKQHYCVFGNPIKHSLSPEIHAQFAKQFGLEITYRKILAPIEGFADSVAGFVVDGGAGFNITVPFKLEARQIATELTERAKIAGAVNTIKVAGEELLGENTDGLGLVNDLCNNLRLDLTDKTILVLGAGGAARGILLPLLQQNPARILISNRTASKAIELAKIFAPYGKTCGFGLEKIKGEPVNVIINATSAALDNTMPVINGAVARDAVCYELMYGIQTPFMSWAQKHNATLVTDGLGMLVEQAACSFEFWTGQKPETRAVLANLRTKLTQTAN